MKLKLLCAPRSSNSSSVEVSGNGRDAAGAPGEGAARAVDLPHGLRLHEHGVGAPHAVEAAAHGHVRHQRLLRASTVAAVGLAADGRRAQPAHPTPAVALPDAAHVLGRALLLHAAALAPRVLHLLRDRRQLLLRRRRRRRGPGSVGGFPVPGQLQGQVGHGALEPLHRDPPRLRLPPRRLGRRRRCGRDRCVSVWRHWSIWITHQIKDYSYRKW
uniref:Uncharacterized protein n=1 Tax=Setaria italica TaxID=4555 RepID=K3XLW3_SETIT